jgi:lantibiotic modifying enzyme
VSRRWPGAMSSDAFLETAAAIARGLVERAVWHRGRCNWLGAVVEPEDPSRPEYRPLGPRIYDGTAGIALFLAHMAAFTGEASLWPSAVGALRHAVERAAALPPHERDGLHGGTLGIAWAAARCADLLGEEEQAVAARSVVEQLAPAPDSARRPDFMTGAAGAVVGLLGLARELDEPRLVTAACGVGDALFEDATVSRRGWSWADRERPTPHHLCGLAHGAAGIGGALLELFRASGDVRLLEAATGAFAYERSWLDRDSGTWPDLRLPARRGAARTAMTATWCHGEAGIALGRLRATALLGKGPWTKDAEIAVTTTKRHLSAALRHAIDDLSLCHGTGGAAVALLAAGDRNAAEALGGVALDRYGERGDWPCGVYGTTPGLFRGLSGIGWLFLCLHDPSIPAPLSLPGQRLTHALRTE